MKMWIARDFDNTLWLSESKPFQNEDGEFDFEDYHHTVILDANFPEVTFENSPKEVELVLKK